MEDRTNKTCSSSSDSDCDYSDGSLEQVENSVGASELETILVQPYQFEPQADNDEESTGTCTSEQDYSNCQSDRLMNTNWCTCGNCKIMENLSENICCQEIMRVYEKCQESDPPVSCITQHPDFTTVCLNKAVLDVAYYQYRQQYTVLDPKNPNDKYRYVAYRQLVRWCWMYLGKDIRRVLPSCTVTEIRGAFPSSDGDYIGFKLH